MMNIFKINIHPFTYLIALIAFFMGEFRNYITFSIIILIHEAGHILMACFFKWKIEKIKILPFGCLIIFNEKLNKPMYQEFLISIMGIFFQIIFFFPFNKYYNYLIIFFNILPIYPLDGSKILNIFLNKMTNFKNSYFYTIYISYLIIINLLFIIILYKDLLLLIIFLPLLFNLNKIYIDRYKVVSKFYLERYLYKFNFKKIKTIKKLYCMKRDYYHFFLINGNLILEKDYLDNYYKKSL